MLNEDKKSMLIKEVTEEEIKNVILNGKEGKALGLDGFTLSFFKSAWEIVGPNVIAVVRHFFNTWRLLRETKGTFIYLIPKKIDVVKLSDYRPISLCNLLYKFITNIIVDRLKLVITSFV